MQAKSHIERSIGREVPSKIMEVDLDSAKRSTILDRSLFCTEKAYLRPWEDELWVGWCGAH